MAMVFIRGLFAEAVTVHVIGLPAQEPDCAHAARLWLPVCLPSRLSAACPRAAAAAGGAAAAPSTTQVRALRCVCCRNTRTQLLAALSGQAVGSSAGFVGGLNPDPAIVAVRCRLPSGSASSGGGGRASAPYHDDYGISSYNQISGIAGGLGLGWRAGLVALGAVNRHMPKPGALDLL